MLKALNKQLNSFNHEDFTYLKIGAWNLLFEKSLAEFDGIILTANNDSEIEKTILAIRTHENPNIYLKPVFFLLKTMNGLTIHTDGVFDEHKSNDLTKNINEKISKLTGNKSASHKSLEIKLMNYLYSRDGQLIPQKNRLVRSGYSYPFVDCYYKGEDFEKYKLLKQCIKNDWLNEQLEDRVQLCIQCQDSYMIYKETCPKCQSINIQAHDIVHHFPCAHIAPATTFKQDGSDEMVCPKCDKLLRHIGIDYDKPSVVFSCNNCDNNFQLAEVISECHTCNHQNKLEDLVEVDIQAYKISMNGIMKVEHGTTVINEKSPVSDHLKIFEQLVQQERSRTFVADNSSYVVQIDIQSKLFKILNAGFLEQFWKDINHITKNYVSNSIYSCRKDETIYLLMIDKEETAVTLLLEKLEYNLKILLEDNLGSDVVLVINLQNVNQS